MNHHEKIRSGTLMSVGDYTLKLAVYEQLSTKLDQEGSILMLSKLQFKEIKKPYTFTGKIGDVIRFTEDLAEDHTTDQPEPPKTGPDAESIDQALVRCLEVWKKTLVLKTAGRQTLAIRRGRRYAKILTKNIGSTTCLSNWAFVDLTSGDILKPAGQQPAKHARGNILTHDPKTMAWTGPGYLR